jgi:hypothetical protein
MNIRIMIAAALVGCGGQGIVVTELQVPIGVGDPFDASQGAQDTSVAEDADTAQDAGQDVSQSPPDAGTPDANVITFDATPIPPPVPVDAGPVPLPRDASTCIPKTYKEACPIESCNTQAPDGCQGTIDCTQPQTCAAVGYQCGAVMSSCTDPPTYSYCAICPVFGEVCSDAGQCGPGYP